jgi:hypothetical protein
MDLYQKNRLYQFVLILILLACIYGFLIVERFYMEIVRNMQDEDRLKSYIDWAFISFIFLVYIIKKKEKNFNFNLNYYSTLYFILLIILLIFYPNLFYFI